MGTLGGDAVFLDLSFAALQRLTLVRWYGLFVWLCITGRCPNAVHDYFSTLAALDEQTGAGAKCMLDDVSMQRKWRWTRLRSSLASY